MKKLIKIVYPLSGLFSHLLVKMNQYFFNGILIT